MTASLRRLLTDAARNAHHHHYTTTTETHRVFQEDREVAEVVADEIAAALTAHGWLTDRASECRGCGDLLLDPHLIDTTHPDTGDWCPTCCPHCAEDTA